MRKMSSKELYNIEGGSISGTLINAFVRGIKVFLDLGRSLGNAIRRISGNAICKL